MRKPPALEYYKKRARDGYGLRYPDGHIVRIFESVLKGQFGFDPLNKNILDFGCWNGTHMQYFSELGLIPYGVDIIEDVIQEAKSKINNHKENIHLIDDDSILREIIKENMDIFFSNQVLYFLDSETLSKRLSEANYMLNENGYFIATMISRKCYFSKYSVGVEESGLERVVFPEDSHLGGNVTFVRFIEDENHLIDVFSEFECLQIGKYDISLDMKNSTEHFIYIGTKKK